ncbi:transketolase C-terminal domain-containing protein [uncultured Agrococcus sp.]|uniref:transketolase C-terminal domain-containing protein n=1 Tax=uncultured Agrococcus sp. TaxID=382258 RepID=UPI0025DCC0DB|nr:transketolase C-terminal domain-containing protein [uncultured Agrococcus sp.]
MCTQAADGPFRDNGPGTVLATTARGISQKGIGVTVIAPRWVAPASASIIHLAAEDRIVITMEDGVRVGGIGTRVRQELRAAGVDTPVDELGLPGRFLDHGDRSEILAGVGLDAASVADGIEKQLLGVRLPAARPHPEEEV